MKDFILYFVYLYKSSHFNLGTIRDNKRISQMRALLAARRKQMGDQNRPPMVQYVFDIQRYMFYSIRTVAFWHNNNITPKSFVDSMCYNIPMFYSAAIFL